MGKEGQERLTITLNFVGLALVKKFGRCLVKKSVKVLHARVLYTQRSRDPHDPGTLLQISNGEGRNAFKGRG